MKLCIVGNSHLFGFWDRWHTEFKTIKNLDISLVSTNLLERPLSECIRNNQFIHKATAPKKRMERVHSDLNEFLLPNSQTETEQHTLVLLFGHGICGEATHQAICGGFRTAVFPYHANHQEFVEGMENVMGPISNECLNAMYENYYQLMVTHLKRWLEMPNVKVVGWVASPNVTEFSARKVFGDHILDSGILRWHYENSWASCVKEFTKHDLLDYIINPNELKQGPCGGLDDQFYYLGCSNHASSEFYEQHIEEIFSRILSLGSGIITRI